jgi:hypothetical protein
MKTLLFTLLLTAACAVSAYADASLYLYPRAHLKAGGLSFSDVAIIEADQETSARIGGAPVDGGLIADGYLDESEIRQALAGLVAGRLSIYGTGVRVADGAKPAALGNAAVAVKKGAQVRFHVKNSRIRVEMTGTALQDGAVGDVIPVKLKGSAVSRGTVLNERNIELEL